MEAVVEQLNSLFPLEHKIGYPTHYSLSHDSVRRIKKSRLSFVGGTNLLSPKRYLRARKNQWAIGCIGSLVLRNHSVLLGCGWKDYHSQINLRGRLFYRIILSKTLLHSVRDSSSEKKLHELGITNVINTGCPTLWKLTPEHCGSIPVEKAERVVFTLTDYRRHPQSDAEMIRLLLTMYDKIFFWIQGARDFKYLKTLISGEELKKIALIGTSLSQYDQLLLEPEKIDYVGTRLHAGIRAIQKKHRAIIIGIDSRAIEKHKDFNLAVVERGKTAELAERIRTPFRTKLILPTEKIEAWKAQFNVSESGQGS